LKEYSEEILGEY